VTCSSPAAFAHLFPAQVFRLPDQAQRHDTGNLGPLRLLQDRRQLSVGHAVPTPPVRSLEDFLVNRFGGELYRTFFKDYTEKVWGVPCSQISAEWGAQRIKGLSVIEAIKHALRSGKAGSDEGRQYQPDRKFLYPRLGPGQLWQEVARRVIARAAARSASGNGGRPAPRAGE
jgi:hypothetical protein